MKKFLTVAMTILMLLGTSGLTVLAETDTSVEVYVTISDGAGKLALVQEKITVTDIDGDNALTLNDALYCAHEAKYEGGAAAGYASSEGQYGLLIDTLWGISQSPNYGYCVNNVSSNGLGDPVTDGDHVSAYVISDLTSWSDVYSYFDEYTVATEAGKDITLTLSYNTYDPQTWAPVTLPAENAVITVDGKSTGVTTDAEGKATIQIDDAGTHVISATSEDQILVPPACVATIKATPGALSGGGTGEAEVIPAPKKDSPKTGENANMLPLAMIAVALAGMVVLSCKDKKSYEK